MNPFVITGSVPDEYFCDRRDEAERIIRTVTNGDNLCLISPRRMGKSKLVDFCYGKGHHKLKKHHNLLCRLNSRFCCRKHLVHHAARLL